MSRAPTTGPLEASTFTPEDAFRVRYQLDRLLKSPQFRASRRCQIFLQFVTDHALSGDSAVFKERSLGVAIFGRQPDYDTNHDPVVRAAAAEVRKKLAQYYQEAEHERELRIALSPGSYQPEFQLPESYEEPGGSRLTPSPTAAHIVLLEPAPVVAAVAPPITADRSTRRRLAVAAGAVLLICLVGLTASRILKHPPLDQFWSGIRNSDGVLICLGQPAVFNFRSDEKQVQLWGQVRNSQAWAASEDSVKLKDLVPMPDRYVASGDALALAHLVSVFKSREIPFHIRSSGLTSFADLREHSSVLVGAFNNDWTMRLNTPLRYTFQRRFEPQGGETVWIRDRNHPTVEQWKLLNPWPDWNVTVDYAVISRILTSSTDRPLVMVAGLTEYGTIAGGEFLSTPSLFAQALAGLPSDWPKKNLQIVLQVPVVHHNSGHPQVVATYAW